MYLDRTVSKTLSQALNAFPAVLLTGPRQSGKTTFLRHELSERYDYVSFDYPLEREFARTDPNGFLRRFDQRPALLDEVQFVPELFSYMSVSRRNCVAQRINLQQRPRAGPSSGVAQSRDRADRRRRDR